MKYKPAVNDTIKFTRDSKTHIGTIRWIASSGFLLICDHDVIIKSAYGVMEGCDIYIESTDVISKYDE